MKNVLIIEDELLLAMLNQQVVENAGYFVVGTLTTGEDAVEAAKNNNLDLILMDIFLDGEIDGISAMEKIRTFSNVPVIYVTGNSDPTAQARAEKTNYSHFLVKPVMPNTLQNAIQETIER